jgi:hypothetical protein
MCGDAQIKMLRGNEHSVGIFKAPGLDAINPNSEGLPKGCACLGRWTNEIGNCGAAGFNDPRLTHREIVGIVSIWTWRATPSIDPRAYGRYHPYLGRELP